jgi:hypothetical protein
MKNIDDILQELIAIEPSFAAHEKEMRTLIAQLLAKKPDTHLDEAFVARLRSQLLGMPTPSPFNSFFSSKYLVLGVLALVIIVPIGYYAAEQGIGWGNSGGAVFAMNQQIQHLQGDAYGTLQVQEGGQGGRGAGPVNAIPAEDTSATAPAANPAVTKVATMAYGAGGSTADSRMMLPQGPITVYSYVYKGDPLDLSAEGEVYSRVKNSVSSTQIASQLKKFNFGLVNLNGFADMRVRSFELAEDKPYGYSISASFDDGMISINPNYTEWPGLNGKETPQELPLSTMPKDEEIIAIAKQFLDAHDISLENYGEPSVQGTPEMLAADSTMPQYAPEQVTVTYPLKISGTPVYEDGAYPYGLQVGVSARDKKVMSVYGLTSQTYSSSDYKLETSSDKILSVLSKGGPHAWVPQESDGVLIKKVEIEVGAPTKVLMHTYNYTNGDSQELFVPALSFPVTKAPEGSDQYYAKTILIPLVPDLLTDGGPVLYDAVR